MLLIRAAWNELVVHGKRTARTKKGNIPMKIDCNGQRRAIGHESGTAAAAKAWRSVLVVVGIGLVQIACTAAFYRTMETFGVEKREILVNRIEEARDSQESAKAQFASALDQYRSVVEFDGGNLEAVYDSLNDEYERSLDRAGAVADRIDALDRVAEDLFEEWADEIVQYTDPTLSRQSQRLLSVTRADYGRLLQAMQRAEQSMQPVLALLGDQVLILRHNLNAIAIGAVENELVMLERATSSLIADMERAIAEAGRFIDAMA